MEPERKIAIEHSFEQAPRTTGNEDSDGAAVLKYRKPILLCFAALLLLLGLLLFASRASSLAPTTTKTLRPSLKPSSVKITTSSPSLLTQQNKEADEEEYGEDVVAATGESFNNVLSSDEEEIEAEDAYLEDRANNNSDQVVEEEEEGGGEIVQDAAPRSMPELEYNEYSEGVLYMTYTPAGGMSNQIMELENALILAKLIGRTLYVPRISSHSDFIAQYLKQTYKTTFPADKLLDFTIMSRYTRVIPLNWTNTHLLERFPARTAHIATDYGTYGSTVTRLKSIRAELLYFSGFRMWKTWFRRGIMDTVRPFVAYSQHLRALAMQIAREELGGEYYAVHGRLGDQHARWGGRTSQVFVRNAKFKTWDVKNKLVYLASDDPDDEFFRALRAAARVKTLNDLKSLGIQEFRALFVSPRVQGDMLGVLDKLLCMQAIEFIGTSFSTFTWDIERSRLQLDSVFPELSQK